jgi:hypothetical protein
MRSGSIFLLAFTLASSGCGEFPEEDFGEVGVNPEGKEDVSLSLRIRRGSSSRFYFSTSGAPVLVTVNCSPPSDPDTVGPAFSVYAVDLGIVSSSQEPPKAGFWRWGGPIKSGTHYVTLYNKGSSQASCSVLAQNLPSSMACTERREHRTTATGHNHYNIGTDLSSRWETFPSAGDHWPVWADWNVIYERPVKYAHLLHNLEHGGLVLSYGCSSPGESADCAQAEADLISLVNTFRQARVYITPDPTQPMMLGIRGWRWAYQAECLDATSALKFMTDHFRHGREDIDANSGLSLDFTY